MTNPPPGPALIRRMRVSAGLTQEQAAKLAGYRNQGAWSDIETGKKRIDSTRWRLFLHAAGLVEIPYQRLDTDKSGVV